MTSSTDGQEFARISARAAPNCGATCALGSFPRPSRRDRTAWPGAGRKSKHGRRLDRVGRTAGLTKLSQRPHEPWPQKQTRRRWWSAATGRVLDTRNSYLLPAKLPKSKFGGIGSSGFIVSALAF